MKSEPGARVRLGEGARTPVSGGDRDSARALRGHLAGRAGPARARGEPRQLRDLAGGYDPALAEWKRVAGRSSLGVPGGVVEREPGASGRTLPGGSQGRTAQRPVRRARGRTARGAGNGGFLQRDGAGGPRAGGGAGERIVHAGPLLPVGGERSCRRELPEPGGRRGAGDKPGGRARAAGGGEDTPAARPGGAGERPRAAGRLSERGGIHLGLPAGAAGGERRGVPGRRARAFNCSSSTTCTIWRGRRARCGNWCTRWTRSRTGEERSL